MQNDLPLNQIDELGMILAQIADLEKRANKIKQSIKDTASAGGAKVVEGQLFKATYSETNRAIFDKEAFVEAHGEEAYAQFTKTTAIFSVKVTSK